MLEAGLMMDRPLLFIVRKSDQSLEVEEILAFSGGPVSV
jgi:hypothetical protein